MTHVLIAPGPYSGRIERHWRAQYPELIKAMEETGSLLATLQTLEKTISLRIADRSRELVSLNEQSETGYMEKLQLETWAQRTAEEEIITLFMAPPDPEN